MIVAEPMPVHRTGILTRGNFRHGTDEVIPHFRHVTEPVKDGGAVILYDEGGNWRGHGTAWALAERGHRVTIVTPEPFTGNELARTSACIALRPRLAILGVTFLTEHLIAA